MPRTDVVEGEVGGVRIIGSPAVPPGYVVILDPSCRPSVALDPVALAGYLRHGTARPLSVRCTEGGRQAELEIRRQARKTAQTRPRTAYPSGKRG
jgi:hypothetical protein